LGNRRMRTVVRFWEEKEGGGVQKSDPPSSPLSGQGRKGGLHDRNTGEG
jgi:hypothetical protein